MPFSKVYGLKGKILLEPAIKALIPPNWISPFAKKKPLYNSVHGYMYFKNAQNPNMLGHLYDMLLVLDKKYIGYSIQEDVAPLDKSFGIIGWDIPYTDPKWVVDIVGNKWDPKFNPTIDKDEIIQFGKSSITPIFIHSAVRLLRVHDKAYD